jgi:hypothetical protein
MSIPITRTGSETRSSKNSMSEADVTVDMEPGAAGMRPPAATSASSLPNICLFRLMSLIQTNQGNESSVSCAKGAA